MIETLHGSLPHDDPIGLRLWKSGGAINLTHQEIPRLEAMLADYYRKQNDGMIPTAELLHIRLAKAAQLVNSLDYTKRPIVELLKQASLAVRDASHILERRFGHSDSPRDPAAQTAMDLLTGHLTVTRDRTAQMPADVQAEHAATWPGCHTWHGQVDPSVVKGSVTAPVVEQDPETCQQCNGTIEDHVEETQAGPFGSEFINYRCLINDLSDVIADMETCEPPVEDGWIDTLKLVRGAYQAKLGDG